MQFCPTNVQPRRRCLAFYLCLDEPGFKDLASDQQAARIRAVVHERYGHDPALAKRALAREIADWLAQDLSAVEL